MNKLSRTDRAKILGLMVEGMSMRAISRVTGASKNTIVKLLEDAGQTFSDYQDHTLRGLTCKRIQCDEIWSFVYAKKKNVPGAKSAPEEAGDAWTWMALDADTKLIVSFFVGDRTVKSAHRFMNDVADRLSHRVQLTTDAHKAYLDAIESAFGGEIDYGKLNKIYGDTPGGAGRYSPGVCIGAEKERMMGNPDEDHISTSFIERANLTLRMGNRRFTRLTNAFSKKMANHEHSVAIHTMHYNFVRMHQTLRCSPAMAAGVSATLWELEDMVIVLEDWEAAN